MTRVGALISLATLGVGILLVLFFGSPEQVGPVYIPVGYAEEVQRWVDDEKLYYDCSARQISSRDLTDAEVYFKNNSYLQRDIAAFASGERRFFRTNHQQKANGECEGELEGINAFHHNQRIPGRRLHATWHGKLTLRRDTRTGTLIGDRRLEISKAGLDYLPFPARAYHDAWFSTTDARRKSERAPRLALKFDRDDYFATLQFLGDDPVLEVTEYEGARPDLLINGCPLDVGSRWRIDAGDVVRLSHRSQLEDEYRYDPGGTSGLVSFVSRINGTLTRQSSDSELDIGNDVGYAIEAAARLTVASDTTLDFDVQLTLDGVLTDVVNGEMEAFFRQEYPGRALRASVAVLEVESGRTLALGSYPGPHLVGDDGPIKTSSDVTDELLMRNHNFALHPVGSASKPFLAAAALSLRPELARLRIPCHSSVAGGGSMLGYPFPDYKMDRHSRCSDSNTGHPGYGLGFDEFMEFSCNRYMVYLGLLALSSWDKGQPVFEEGPFPAADRFMLGRREHRRRPALSAILKSDADASATDLELANVQDGAYWNRLRELFDVEYFYEASQPRVERYDFTPWRGLFSRQDWLSRAADAQLAFEPVASEHANMRTNLIRRLRRDLYTTLLGGSENRWSNLQLAEALARVMTGKRVETSLVEQVSDGGKTWSIGEDTAEVETLELSEEVQRTIMSALRTVVGPRGTASALGAERDRLNEEVLDRSVRYDFYAKTGTPQHSDLSEIRPTQSVRSPDSLKFESSALVVGIRRTRGSEESGLALAVYVEGQGSGVAVRLTKPMIRPLLEAMWPEDWLESD